MRCNYTENLTKHIPTFQFAAVQFVFIAVTIGICVNLRVSHSSRMCSIGTSTCPCDTLTARTTDCLLSVHFVRFTWLFLLPICRIVGVTLDERTVDITAEQNNHMRIISIIIKSSGLRRRSNFNTVTCELRHIAEDVPEGYYVIFIRFWDFFPSYSHYSIYRVNSTVHTWCMNVQVCVDCSVRKLFDCIWCNCRS